MAYIIKRSDSSILTVIEDRVIDQDTLPLALVGRGAINYGTAFATNFVRLFENFAAAEPPANPMVGSLWYKTDYDVPKLKIYDGSIWKSVDGDPTPVNVPLTVVARDAMGNFQANNITANLAGIADSARRWLAPRAVALTGDASGTVFFDGSSDVSMGVLVNHSKTADRWTTPRTLTLAGQLAGSVTWDGSGNATLNGGFYADTIQTNISGNSGSATRLQNARAINLVGDATGGAYFDGTTDIQIGVSLRASGVAPGVYNVVQVDAQGRVIGARNDDLTQVVVNQATNATNATYAVNSTNATNATNASNAGYAANAGHSGTADRATTADRLTFPRVINISGAVSGAAYFDGNGDINIPTSSNIAQSGGDVTNGGNAGGGLGLFIDKQGGTLRFRSLFPGSGISIDNNGESFTLNCTVAGGSATRGATRRYGAGADGTANTLTVYDPNPNQPDFNAHAAQWNTIVFVRCPDTKAGIHHVHVGFSHLGDSNWPNIASWFRIVRVQDYVGATSIVYGPSPVNVYSATQGTDREQQFFTDEQFSGNQLFAVQYLPLSAGYDAGRTGIATPNQFIAITEWAN